MSHKYTISVKTPKLQEIQPFDWESHKAAINEMEFIIQNAMARHFRKMQSTEIEMILMNRTCPKCRGKLFPSEDGVKCFSCGLIVYRDVIHDKTH